MESSVDQAEMYQREYKIDATILQSRVKLIGRWMQNLYLYKLCNNSAYNSMLQDYLPLYREVPYIMKRRLNQSQTFQQQQKEEDQKYFRIMKNIIDNYFEYVQEADIQTIKDNFRQIVHAIIRGQLSNIDLLEFFRYFEDQAKEVLSLRIQSQDNYLPYELIILLNYVSPREGCLFQHLWDYFRQIGVDQQVRPEIALRFALEAGNIEALDLFFSEPDCEERFFALDLHTYAAINVVSFKYLIGHFQRRNMLERLLNTKDQFGYQPIHAVALLGSCDLIVELAKVPSYLNALAADGMSVLECVFCSANTIAYKLVVQLLLDGDDTYKQLAQCENTYKLNYYHLSIINADQNALELLQHYGHRKFLFMKSADGKTPIWMATNVADPRYLRIISQSLTKQELKQVLSRFVDNEPNRKDTHYFVSPMESLHYNYQRQHNFIIANVTKITITIYFIVFSLAFILPPLLLEKSYIQSVHFMVSESVMFVIFSYNIVMLFMINFAWKPEENVLKITDITDFKKISYCVQGDRILMNSSYFHCDTCNKCQPVGSYHSNLLGLCIYENQRWMYATSIFLALIAFLVQLYLGYYNVESTALAVIQAIFQIVLVIFVTILSLTLISFSIFVYYNNMSKKR